MANTHAAHGKHGRFVIVSASDRFWPRVKQLPDKGCWLWLGSQDRYGYGWFSGWGEKKAHRASWAAHFGPVPPGVHVLHNCDNPTCVRPDHLYLGNNTKNQHDKRVRGRARGINRGEGNGNARLTTNVVRKLRRLHVAGITCRELASRFGVSASNVSRITRGNAWAHVK